MGEAMTITLYTSDERHVGYAEAPDNRPRFVRFGERIFERVPASVNTMPLYRELLATPLQFFRERL